MKKINESINSVDDLSYSLGTAKKILADELRDNQDYKSYLLSLCKHSGLELSEVSAVMTETVRSRLEINPELRDINFRQIAESAVAILLDENIDNSNDPESYEQYADEEAESIPYIAKNPDHSFMVDPLE